VASQLTPEEVEALAAPAEEAKRAVEVLERDFREPRRLAREELDRLARAAARSIDEIEGSLRVWLRAPYKVEIASVAEVNAQRLLSELATPFCLLAFECAGRPCWAVWDATFASAATEVALGVAEVDEPEARTLTPVERGVLRNLLGRVIGFVGHALGVQPKDVRYVADDVQLALERADAREGDPTRLAVHVALSGPLGETTLRLHFAGVGPTPQASPQSGAKDKKKLATPEHLVEIPFELGAQLGTADVALSDLLGLEPGDVIPLPAAVGSPLAVYVDGIPCASARFGEHRGKLAIQLLTFSAPGADPQT
jgi:flagellar motor switch protein FliM